MENRHVIWHNGCVCRKDRERKNNHKSLVLWFTGLSASGKSTIAHLVEKELFERGVRAYVLNGDNIRHGLNSDLGFSREDRMENLRRVAEVSKLMVDAGIIVLAAFISPYLEDRAYVRSRFPDGEFLEIYVKCPMGICEQRDPKGQYKKARAGLIKNYTGISSPYEEPQKPELVIDTEKMDIGGSVHLVMGLLEGRCLKKILSDEGSKQ